MSTSPADVTIAMLRTGGRAGPLTPEEWKRVKARAAWALHLVERWYEAMLHRDEVCTAAAERLFSSPGVPGEGDQNGGGALEGFNRLFDAEEAKVAAIRARIDAVIERDEWPREMHFKCI